MSDLPLWVIKKNCIHIIITIDNSYKAIFAIKKNCIHVIIIIIIITNNSYKALFFDPS